MDRRNFLSLLAGAALAPAGIANTSLKQQSLVIIELQGGNDGLNTVVPFADPAYATLRPTVKLDRDKLWKLDEQFGLHPDMSKLKGCWEDKQLAIVQGLGYDDPNRSHFRSHDIWATASAADERKQTGWLADELVGSVPSVQAVIFGNRVSLVEGRGLNYISMRRTRDFIRAKLPEIKGLAEQATPSQRHLHTVLQNTLKYQGVLRNHSGLKTVKDAQANFGSSLFAKQLADAAQLIRAGVAPPVISLSLRGFDTHANQHIRQAKLLKELSTALAGFRQELLISGHWNDTLVVTWSEFGRRAAENASGGTDHGTAAPQFLLGGRVNGGLHGVQPSLSDLQNDDLVHRVDFKQLYAAISEQWWGKKDSTVWDKKAPPLRLIRSV